MASGIRGGLNKAGAEGANAARVLDSWGASVVAVSDVDGGIYDESGLDIESSSADGDEHGQLGAVDAPRQLSNAELLELDVDVLIPAAVGNVLTEENDSDVHANCCDAPKRPASPRRVRAFDTATKSSPEHSPTPVASP